MNILYVTEDVPFNRGKNEQTRAYYQIKSLVEKGLNVDCIFFHDNFIYFLPATDVLKKSFNQKNIIVYKRANIKRNFYFSILKGFPASIAKYTTPELYTIIRKQLTEKAYDAIHIQSCIAHNIILDKSLPRLVIDYKDSLSLSLKRELKCTTKYPARILVKEELRRTIKHELKLLKNFPNGIIQSIYDREQFGLESNLKVVPNIQEIPARLKKSDKKKALVFTGILSDKPHIEAAESLVNKIYLPLKQEYSDLECWIIGDTPSYDIEKFNDIDGVTVTGTVEDVIPFLRNGAVYVAPQKFGTGFQSHLTEAATQMKPIVLSEEMSSCVGFTHNKEALVSITENDFIANIKNILDDSYIGNRISRNAKKLIKRKHSKEFVTNLLIYAYRVESNELDDFEVQQKVSNK